ncbi:hypothetical protein JTE90_017083 [Oedothorax gibbosus]|uniref:Hermansky-Pudlak syndrome 1 n=1 Tax=Oedothorax gibbosus TaxID=931172 RepID=A0AAV6ULL4_9ARAC|nr:hypothetical protein JTE90_017083 [Oedothorax gibbosus]
MKGIILFDNLNDIAFFDVDEALSNHIKKLALKDGLLEGSLYGEGEQEVDKNVVMQLFSPLIASYKVMNAQFGNKYKYIESEDGVMLVFDEILNYIAISICHKEETLEEIQKELSFFLIIVEMLYGPSLHMLKNNYSLCCNDISRSDLVALILEKWRMLKMEQQMYLVEAIERIIINQDITAMCVNLLQEILEKIRNSHKDGTHSHAFALVDTKLLALYSSRNSGQLPKETLLLLILIVQVLKQVSLSKEEEAKKDDEFFIPISANKEENKIKAFFKRKGSETEEQCSNLKAGSHSVLLYLKSRSGVLVPHIFYVIEVTPRITISILNELADYGTISSSASHLIHRLNNIQNHPLSRTPLGSFEALETEFRSLMDLIWKIKSSEEKEKHLKKLVSKWEQLKQHDLEVYFRTPKDKTSDSRLESGLSSCCDLLKVFFEECIAVPCLKYEKDAQREEHQEILKTLQKLSIRRIKDVANFLEIKYIVDYPGLIHFMYINRNTDCMVAPHVVLTKGHLNGVTSLKKKIWKMVSVGRKYIDGAKNFCCLWTDDDLKYFYHIWFEDSTGVAIKPTCYPSLKKIPKRGIICGNFYRKLVKECFPAASYDHITCYEFYSVHLESTSTDVIIEHSKKLCAQLWDLGGAYRTSLDLL